MSEVSSAPVQSEPTQGLDAASSPHDRDDWDRHWAEYAESAARTRSDFRRRLVLRLLGDLGPAVVCSTSAPEPVISRRLFSTPTRPRLLGLELSQGGVEVSRRKGLGATFLQRDLLVAGPPPDEYASWATHAVCSEVLEHVDDPKALLVNAVPFLAPGCRLVVTVPGGPMTAYDRHIGHRQHFDPTALGRLLREAGFEVLEATGAGFPVFNVYRLLMRALGKRLVAVAGASKPSALSRIAMRAFAFGLGSIRSSRAAAGRSSPSRGQRGAALTRRTMDELLAVRLLIAAAAAAGLTLAAYVTLPESLDVRTDIVGFPTFANFNIDRYFWLYGLAVGFLPVATLGLYLALTRIFVGRLPPVRPLPRRPTGSSRYRKRLGGVSGPSSLGRTLLVGGVFGLEAVIVVGRASDVVVTTVVTTMLAYGAGVVFAGWLGLGWQVVIASRR